MKTPIPFRATFHNGVLKRYVVKVRCVSHPELRYNEENAVVVFSTAPENAKLAASEKMTDKFLRHQDKRTRWVAISEPEEC